MEQLETEELFMVAAALGGLLQLLSFLNVF